MAADTPPTPRVSKPSPKGMAQSLKDPKVLVAVAIVGVMMALYFRSRQNANANLPASDGSLTPIGDYEDYYPGATQGAAVTGGYGGYDSPTMNEPEWLTNPPNWVLDPPTWWGNEPAPTNSADPSANPTVEKRGVVVFNDGKAIYDPETGQTHGTIVTGGGPPTTPNHAAPKPPSNGGKPKTNVGSVNTNQSGNKNQGLRYKVVKRPMKKGGKPHIFHDYESKPGKGDFGKGKSVNMGPAK